VGAKCRNLRIYILRIDGVSPAATFDIIVATSPKDDTSSVLTEMRRLLEDGGLRYVLLVLQPRQAGGNTQK
jgi:hypothetical protein